jgi:MFS transporter, DHA1 family, multidrug resistance protein
VIGETERAAGARMSERALRSTMAFDYLLSNFGRFTLMPVMAIFLAVQSEGATWVTGVGLFAFMLCTGLSSLLVSRWLPRFSYAASMSVSMVLSAAGFGLLPYTTDPVTIMSLLLVAGFGISVHNALVRVLIAEMIESQTGRNNVYSIQQIATNAAAALGPFIAGALYVSGDGRPLLTFVGVAYLLAALSLVAGLPRGLYPPRTGRERAAGASGASGAAGFAGGARLMWEPRCRDASMVTAIGSFAYAQFYSAFALMVALAIDSTPLRGALLAGPPIIIVVLQTPVTAIANRHLVKGVPPLTILTVATLVFGCAMVFLAVGLPVVLGATVAMAVFASAEMLFTPMVSMTFNRITSVSRLAASNLQAFAWTSGEATGSLCGGALFLLCRERGMGGLYWLLLATATIAGGVTFLRRAIPERTIS